MSLGVNKLMVSVLCMLLMVLHTQAQTSNKMADGPMERKYLVAALNLIATPVLTALGKNELKKQMPVEAADTAESRSHTHLEAFARLLSGMAPWLELGPDSSEEGKLRKKFIELAVVCIHNATDSASADYMNFNQGKQPLVDAAFLAQALIRAPRQLWNNLDATTRRNVLHAFKSSRVILPSYSNWLLFSAMVETAIFQFEGNADQMRIDYALKQFSLWYKGDGTYGDGQYFHWDYYNSFVMHPMLLEILQTMTGKGLDKKAEYATELARARRYAAVQERLISPEGTYPPIGHSLAYRFGAFQLLSKISLLKALPEKVKPQQVRAALYTVIKRQMEMAGQFDAHGWLQLGLAGHQPAIAEAYISTGSLYHCAGVFLVLGLPSTDDFWNGPDEDWTAKKIWKGIDVAADYPVD